MTRTPVPLDESLILHVASTYGLPTDLLRSQIIQESSGDPWAFRYEPAFYDRYINGNPKALGAAYGPLAACSYGLLQIMLETAMEIGFSDRPERLFDPKVGLAFGAKKMRALWDWAGGLTGDYARALAAYNGGTGMVLAGGPPFKNQAYVDAIYVRAQVV